MDTIKDIRRRLAALSTVDTDSPSPATSLADCRAIQSRLRELKREVLERIAALRTGVSERARESVRSRPSIGEDWKRRRDDAKQLLADVQKRVIGLVDGRQGKALEAWAQVSEEIDARLAKLEELETRLARVAGETVAGPPPLPAQAEAATDDDLYAAAATTTRPPKPADAEEDEEADDDLYAATGAAAKPPEPADEDEEASDDLYAAVGATVRKAGKAAAYCPHCGQGVEADDRFCRRCGHRLEKE